MGVHIHRITVRGFFDGLDDRARAVLAEVQDEHTHLRSGFSAEGGLVYDLRYGSFSFRFEVRTTDDDGPDHAAAALRIATEKAEAALAGMGVGSKRLRAVGSDMADMWTATD